MDVVVYNKYYRTRTADCQLEIDECLRRNLNHPGISKVVLFKEADAPPLPQASVPMEVVESDKRNTFAEWFRWVKRQVDVGIGLLPNADIYLDEGLQHVGQRDVWGVRADAELPVSLLYTSSFPLGFPGSDNRIAYLMCTHGGPVRNTCYHVRSAHLLKCAARSYDKTNDRLCSDIRCVHPRLAPDVDAELKATLWTPSPKRHRRKGTERQPVIDRTIQGFGRDQITTPRHIRPPINSIKHGTEYEQRPFISPIPKHLNSLKAYPPCNSIHGHTNRGRRKTTVAGLLHNR